MLQYIKCDEEKKEDGDGSVQKRFSGYKLNPIQPLQGGLTLNSGEKYQTNK